MKYLGSKRRLVGVLGTLFSATGGGRALDLFTGTTRVAQELKNRGGHVTAVDRARYAHVFAQSAIETDARTIERDALDAELSELDALPPAPGYVTETFCQEARFFRPENGARIDAIREAIEARRGHPHYPILLTSLIEAADRVDSTTGVQMAYLKEWAPRAHQRLTLRVPDLLDGAGRAIHGDAVELMPTLGTFDFAYLDPPYNQHRYEANYHVWETLVAWDAPEPYGVARKRLELSDRARTSAFNRRRQMPEALRACIDGVDARVVVISYNDESWIEIDELVAMGRARGAVEVFGFDSKRYVGAQIGIHDPKGTRVGEVSHLRNTEYVMVCGDPDAVDAAARALAALAESGASGVAARGGARNSRPGP
ncbi:MAG: DNA adenine methylase [Acidimicrobiia bacterium]|nr:DNA adenine methylase [Acidimicrobiia bacterium]